MSDLTRRSFLRASALTAGAAALAGPFEGLVSYAAAPRPAGRQAMFGSLAPVADLRDDVVRMALPPGYSYRSFGLTGSVMTDGSVTPGRQDGMAAFRGPRNTIRVVRNHEVRGHGSLMGGPGMVGSAYDANTNGGTSTLSIDARSRELLGDWVSLTGTSVNCAGGAMPWGTWISAEETVNGPDLGPDFTGSDGPASFEKHGYIFEVDPAWGPGELGRATPIRSAGRFAHEAVAYDAATNALYETEDNFEFPSGMYRYLPPENAMDTRRIADGGTLQMLRVPSMPGAELALPQPAGVTYVIDWVDIADPDWDLGPGPTDNDTGIQELGLQGFAQGAAAFARPEGIWERDGLIYFSCTRGGGTGLSGNLFGEYGNGFGQVWVIDPQASTLTLLFESPGPDVLDLPDNLTVSNRGNIILCEDGSTDNYLRVLTRQGELFDFAKNMIAGSESQEFAGACISPDGRTMFVNIQFGNGLTFAIWRDQGGLRL